MKTCLSGVLLCTVFALSAYGDSFLVPQKFSKTIKDLPFAARIELMADGYTPYEIVYDNNGVCVSGCAYKGVTIQDDMDAVNEANEQMAALIAAETATSCTTDSCQISGQSTSHQPSSSLSSSIGLTSTGTGVYEDWCRNGLSTKLPLRYPVDMSNLKYKIGSDFGFREHSANGARFHPALDIGCPSGTPVYATADGVVDVVRNETSLGSAGYYINIKHENGFISQYLHLSKQLVKEGDEVKACQLIAYSGNSGKSIEGKSYGAHLDYRIRFNSDNKTKFVDILCPCKASTRDGDGQTSETDLECVHSLFNAPYKFNSQANKRKEWRVRHGHCMKTENDLLPDEVLK